MRRTSGRVVIWDICALFDVRSRFVTCACSRKVFTRNIHAPRVCDAEKRDGKRTGTALWLDGPCPVKGCRHRHGESAGRARFRDLCCLCRRCSSAVGHSASSRHMLRVMLSFRPPPAGRAHYPSQYRAGPKVSVYIHGSARGQRRVLVWLLQMSPAG
jgi:hypothetical protein